MSLATKIGSAIYAHNAVNKIRAEHDAFVRTATLGTTYYTVKPHSTYDQHTGRPVHVAYTFTRRGHGIHAGQLIADGFGAGSWTIWYQHGPLTTQRMPTAADHRADDDMAFAAFSASAQQQITATATAELRRLYPASVEHLVAA